MGPVACRWAAGRAAGLFATSLGHPHRRWVARRVVGLLTIHWALHISLGHSPCHGPCPSSLGGLLRHFGLSSRRWAIHLVVGLFAVSLGPTSSHLALDLVVWPIVALLG